MPKFGKRSRSRLSTCDSRLQNLFNEIIKYFDCSILEGHRGEKEQNEAYAKGNSKLRYPDGKHNKIPSIAVDVVPYPIDWNDRERFHYMGGMARGIGHVLGIDIRWGGDWDSDGEIKDNSFDDLVHIELKE